MSVDQSVGLPIMIMSPAKMAEVIELLFRLWTRVVPRNDVLHEDQIRRAKGAVLRGEKGGRL